MEVAAADEQKKHPGKVIEVEAIEVAIEVAPHADTLGQTNGVARWHIVGEAIEVEAGKDGVQGVAAGI